MSIKTYSLKKDGSTKLSKNFTVREFACSDGSDTVKIDLDNVKNLQKIRDHFGTSVRITSGYRTKTYNAKIGGAKNSLHTFGQAADIVISGVDALKVALYADSIGCHGVIYYPVKKFTHIDTRSGFYHAICIGDNYFPEPGATMKKGSSGDAVKWIQHMLRFAGYKLSVDGKFGSGTVATVKAFQQAHGLDADGVFGSKTKKKLKEVLM